jgi:hypothetical protein
MQKERKQTLNDQETWRKSLNVAGDEEVTDHKVKCEFFYDGSQNLARFN